MPTTFVSVQVVAWTMNGMIVECLVHYTLSDSKDTTYFFD